MDLFFVIFCVKEINFYERGKSLAVILNFHKVV